MEPMTLSSITHLRALVAALALVIGLAWGAATPAAALAESPRAVTERLDAALLGVMRNAEQLGYRGRREALAPVLAEAFDYPFMARVAVGRYWSRLDAAEQSRLVATFADLSVATFAARFDGYNGERFEIIGEVAQPRGNILVRNRLVKANGEGVEINFVMHKRAGGWRIADVFLDAKFSELATKRSEYTSVLKRDGFADLIQVMEQKIAAYAAETKS